MRPMAFATALAAMSVAASAASAVTIVQYRQVAGGSSVRFVNAVGGGYTLSTVGRSAPVRITLFDPLDASSTLNILGTFQFSASGSSPAVVSSGFAFQEFSAGTFALTSPTPVSFLGRTGTNILSGAFSKGTLSGQLGGRAATFSVSIPASVITSTSDFFLPNLYELTNFSLGLSDSNRALRLTTNNRLRNFRASSVGTLGAVAAVPEPTTWALLILGFGMVGASMRRQRGVTRVIA